MKKVMYLFGYLSIACVTTGLVFKLQHWTGAGIMLVLGAFLLNIIFLPLFFLRKARS